MRRDDVRLGRLVDAINVSFDGIDVEIVNMYLQDIVIVSWIDMDYNPTVYTFISQSDGSFYYAKDWNAKDDYRTTIGYRMQDILNGVR